MAMCSAVSLLVDGGGHGGLVCVVLLMDGWAAQLAKHWFHRRQRHDGHGDVLGGVSLLDDGGEHGGLVCVVLLMGGRHSWRGTGSIADRGTTDMAMCSAVCRFLLTVVSTVD